MAMHFLLPDAGDCAIFDIRRYAHFVQSYTSCNRCNRAILLFGALWMEVLPHFVRQDDREGQTVFFFYRSF